MKNLHNLVLALLVFTIFALGGCAKDENAGSIPFPANPADLSDFN